MSYDKIELVNPKSEARNPKQIPMTQISNSKQYDLEARTFEFARSCRSLVKRLPKNISNFEDGKQLVRSSGSVAANYIEANESLSKKDFLLRIKISKKEAKESCLWLKLIEVRTHETELQELQNSLQQEARELMNILGAILHKSL